MDRVKGSSLMANFNFTSKYAKYLKDKKKRESFSSSIDRMMDMHINKFKDKFDDNDLNRLAEIRSFIKDKKLLGSQRALQFAGPPIEKVNIRSYNCTASYCDRPRFFAECFYALLCGTGVGFSVQKHHVAQLPPIDLLRRVTKPYIVEDTIEGWADALDTLVKCYLQSPDDNIPLPIFDYSKIREKGAHLSSGGKAPGPEPLKLALTRIENIFRKTIEEGRSYLRPIDAYDIVMHSADSVISGGVRRSATACLFSPDDTDMIHAKTGNWFIENPQRGR